MFQYINTLWVTIRKWGREKGEGGTMYAQVSRYKNDKIKEEKNKSREILKMGSRIS
jgi:hypothetical protein